ncbi:MAG: GDP-mannose 4,6-dehydratase [Phycisphaerales bacterium]|nr:NAD-dependent epimerase/dehydratase family protein [Planctomycetota bacterium]MCH8509465.1 GDP-mannose 4,6-dehydratase [Phycisphaerales bacterium]
MEHRASNQEPAAPRRVLVTGGAGFIGSHLVEHLVGLGHRVTVVDDLSTGHASNLDAVAGRVELIESDLEAAIPSLGKLPRFDRVFHLAATVGVDLVLTDPVRAIEINVGTTSALLAHLASHGKPPTLVASSSEVYGKPGASVFSEDDDTLYGPTTITRWSYAHAKALDEHLAMGYHHSRGLPTVSARFFNTVGPRQRGTYGMVVPRFVESALNGEPLRVFGDGHQSRCFGDVRDIVPALVRLLDSPACHGRVFNLGSDRPVTILELAETVIRTLDSRSTVRLIPYEDAYPSGFEDLRHRRPDLARVREAIGFSPGIGLEQTIRDIAADMRARPAAARGGNGGGA